MIMCYIILTIVFFWNSEDADSLRIHTLSEIDDVESIKKMVDDSESDTDGEDSAQ